MVTKPSRGRAIPSGAPRILLVEDDREIGRIVASDLRDAGYAVGAATDGERGLELLQRGSFDLLVLDLNLPRLDGLEVCRRLRETDRLTPVLMLTARAGKQDVVRGLELGADDYITKPFSSSEFIARVRALLRRSGAAERQDADLPEALPAVQRGSLLIEPSKRQATLAGRALGLTTKEFELLWLFARHPGRVFNRDELLNRVWGTGFEGQAHTVNTHINRLRNKLETEEIAPQWIETVWGHGYRFTDQPR
jgi:DNA-binding response OmpR family regulator